jgi:dTDP-4-dehydrorhamnose 3,5-epimerase
MPNKGAENALRMQDYSGLLSTNPIFFYQICPRMVFTETPLKGAYVIDPKVFGDERGYFFESYRKSWFEEAGIHVTFVQDNQSLSNKGILRGLHFQKPPHAQGKLVRVISGSVLDVIVDLRKDSQTYGHHFTAELNGENKRMLWIPAGFGHGFATLQDQTVFCYKCTNVYNPESEGGLMWNDPALGIDWGIQDPKLSEKDTFYDSFERFDSPF